MDGKSKVDKTAYEFIRVQKPNMQIITGFRSPAFLSEDNKKKNRKLDERAENGALVGICRENAYFVLILSDKVIVESNDVKFYASLERHTSAADKAIKTDVSEF